MAYLPDYNDLYDRHDAEQQRKLDRLPECSECDNPIQDDTCYEINGELICPECLKNNHQKNTEEFIF